MADKVTARLHTGNWDRFLDGMKDAAVGKNGIVALALKDVADDEALPSIREKTPFKTGRARRAWRVGGVHTGQQTYVNLINKEPYVRLLEFGTLGRRKKKLKDRTLARRRQKAGVLTERGARRLKTMGRTAAEPSSRAVRLWESKGGIKPYRMVGRTIRELRAKGSVPLAIQKRMKKSALSLRRDVRRARG